MKREGFRFTLISKARAALIHQLARLKNDEDGQATTEYILLMSVLFLFSTNLAKSLLRVLDNGILKFGAQLEKDLKTGRTRLSAWKN